MNTQSKTPNDVNAKAARPARQQPPEASEELHPREDLVRYFKRYAREKPDITALWCFGIGVVVGWKIKPW